MTAIENFCLIIQSEMSLENGQVTLWDQKINIPPDDRLYITVGVSSCKPFGNTNNSVPTMGGLTEVLSTNFQATLMVDIYSRSSAARDRKEEVILALKSTYSQQVQEANALSIASISSGFTNLSQIEGAAIPYRFNISVNIQYVVTKTKPVPFYDTFTDISQNVITDP